MKVIVNKDVCLGCGACAAVCPNVFEINDEGYAVVKEASEADSELVNEAKDGCPVSAISTE